MEQIKNGIAIYFLIAYCFVSCNALDFIVSAPNIFRVDVPETIGISIDNYDKPVNVEVVIRSLSTKADITSSRVDVESGKPKLVTLTFPESAIPEAQKSDEVLFVNLLIRAPKNEFPSKEILVPVKKFSGYAFLQTDKPLYRSTELVKIRMLNLNENLSPSNQPITLEINNPESARIVHEEFKPDVKGIIEYVFKFPIFPEEGNWSASIKYGYQMNATKTVQFEVKDYDLPTYSVTIKPPEVILNTENKFGVRILAEYVYGKPVVGILVAKFSIKDTAGRVRDIKAFYEQHFDGDIYLYINIEKDIKQQNIKWFPSISGSRLLISAEVIERVTGNIETAIDHTAIFSYSPFEISFPASSLDFKPGVSYQVKILVKSINGQVASNIPVEIIKAVTKKNRRLLRTLKNPQLAYTNEFGRVVFLIGTSTDDEELEITASTKTEDLKNENQVKNTLNVFKFHSPIGNSYVWISAPSQDMVFKVGSTFETQVTVHPTGENVKLHYLVVSRGKILLQDETEKGKKNVIVHPIQFVVTSDMVPSARLIVYIIKQNKIIADSMKIEVDKTCKYNNGHDLKLSAATNIQSYEPGANIKIEITGEANSYVGLTVVDEAVYLLSEKNLLTRKAMFDEMEKHDLGCGAGGGLNTETVFRTSGLLILSNAGLNDHSRKEEECNAKQRKKRSIKSSTPLTVLRSVAAVCCELGKLPSPPDMNCTERAAKIYENIGDKENCSKAFLYCCEGGTISGVIRTGGVGNNEVADDELTVIPDFETFILQNIRKFFPETWIFNTYRIPQCNQRDKNVCTLTIDTSIPDSITTWRVQAVAVSQHNGLCVAEPLKLKVFKPMFIQIKLPQTAVRMEQIQVPVTIFNYGDVTLDERVYMKGIDGICNGAEPGGRTEFQRISIPAYNATTIHFPMVPLEVASYPLIVIAKGKKDDSVTKTLRVVYEGILEEETVSITLDPAGYMRETKIGTYTDDKITESFNGENRQFITIDKRLPNEYISGTETFVASVMGNVMAQAIATSIAGLEAKFFHMPSGCGEQSMIGMAPLVYSMMYLKRTGQLSPNGEKNGYRLIQGGYLNQLNYRKPDGSFAIFRDHTSSVWLTALVAKVFCQANSFIEISKDVTCGALDWMINKQLISGVFRSDYDVYHKEMKGGVEGDLTLTAYVLIALKECKKCNSDKVLRATSRSISYLEQQINFLNQPYPVAVVTYALALAESPLAKIANDKLRNMANYNKATNTRFWGQQGTAIAVETTSYAMLAQMKFNDVAYSHAIANWLNKQRNAQGAFVSTQDTIMALQALAVYSFTASIPELNMVVNISTQVSSQKPISVKLTKQNALMWQKYEIPAGGLVHIDTQGKGIGTVTLTLRYNVKSLKTKTCKFDLKIKSSDYLPQVVNPEYETVTNILPQRVLKSITRPEDQKNILGYHVEGQTTDHTVSFSSLHVIKLEICVRHLDKQPSGMSMLNVGYLTGYIPIKQDLENIVRDSNIPTQQYQLFDKSVAFYLNTVPHSKDLCISFRLTQEIAVIKIKPATVKIYDYYEPSQSCEKFYTADNSNSKSFIICDKGKHCSCAQGKCFECDPFEDIKNADNSRSRNNDLLILTCRKYNFVWYGVLRKKTKTTEIIRYEFFVTHVIKEGMQNTEDILNKIIVFTGSPLCDCPHTRGKTYIIMGRDGVRTQNEETKVWTYQYFLDYTTKVYEIQPKLRGLEAKEQGLQKSFSWLFKRMIENKTGCDH